MTKVLPTTFHSHTEYMNSQKDKISIQVKALKSFLQHSTSRKSLIVIENKAYNYENGYQLWEVFDETNKKVVCFTVHDYENFLRIHRLDYIDTECRSNGVANALTEKVIEYAKSRNMEYVEAIAQHPEHLEFMRPLGFIQGYPDLKQILTLREPTNKKAWWVFW
ncbi:MAG: GNAT family N-acetyltransferase [Candidatus Caenarcaniphilales bacterium]|nr:GNAT family N-acetyltransferase [Candidatus Caenarcaniphilales bacterium]